MVMVMSLMGGRRQGSMGVEWLLVFGELFDGVICGCRGRVLESAMLIICSSGSCQKWDG